MIEIFLLSLASSRLLKSRYIHGLIGCGSNGREDR